jgi:hypothetical protein
MAGLVPAIPTIERCDIPIEIAGTSPAMTPRVEKLAEYRRFPRALNQFLVAE